MRTITKLGYFGGGLDSTYIVPGIRIIFVGFCNISNSDWFAEIKSRLAVKEEGLSFGEKRIEKRGHENQTKERIPRLEDKPAMVLAIKLAQCYRSVCNKGKEIP